MAKQEKSIAISTAAGLAARSLARLENAAAEVHADETAKRERSLQMVSTNAGFSAVIKHGKIMIEISGSDFAVTQSELRAGRPGVGPETAPNHRSAGRCSTMADDDLTT